MNSIDTFIVIVGVISVIAYLLHAIEKHRRLKDQAPFPTPLMVFFGILAPFGSLMGMLLNGNRMKEKLMIILVPLMLIAFVAGVYFLRGSIV